MSDSLSISTPTGHRLWSQIRLPATFLLGVLACLAAQGWGPYRDMTPTTLHHDAQDAVRHLHAMMDLENMLVPEPGYESTTPSPAELSATEVLLFQWTTEDVQGSSPTPSELAARQDRLKVALKKDRTTNRSPTSRWLVPMMLIASTRTSGAWINDPGLLATLQLEATGAAKLELDRAIYAGAAPMFVRCALTFSCRPRRAPAAGLVPG